MIQAQFAHRVAGIVQKDPSVIGLAVGGSWVSKEMDVYSDLDLVLVTTHLISDDVSRMLAYAKTFGNLLSGFTGEHVGEPRLLICLFDNPLLHVDIKFLTTAEFVSHLETPVILADTNGQLQGMLRNTSPHYPLPDYQWIEDRFWIWIHYALQKIGRGELFETIEFISFLRSTVLGPLLQSKRGALPRGVRKIENHADAEDLLHLKATVAAIDRSSLLHALEACVYLYRKLRQQLYDRRLVHLQQATEATVMLYFKEVSAQQ